MRTVKTGRHEESRTVDIAAEMEGGMRIFIGLYAGEGEPQRNGENQPPFQTLAIVFQQRVVRPGDRGAGGKEDQRIEQRQMPWIECLDAFRRPHAVSEGKPRYFVLRVGKQSGIEIGP